MLLGRPGRPGKGRVYARMTISLDPKLSDQVRMEATKERTTLAEMFIRYHDAYLRELEREKELKKTEKR